MTSNSASCLRRSIVSLAALCGLCTFGVAVAGKAESDRSDKEAIAALIYCYAQGTDAIGDSTTNADPLAAGAAIYRQVLHRKRRDACVVPAAAFRLADLPESGRQREHSAPGVHRSG